MKEVKEENEDFWGKSTRGKANRPCKGPGVEATLVCPRKSKERPLWQEHSGQVGEGEEKRAGR